MGTQYFNDGRSIPQYAIDSLFLTVSDFTITAEKMRRNTVEKITEFISVFDNKCIKLSYDVNGDARDHISLRTDLNGWISVYALHISGDNKVWMTTDKGEMPLEKLDVGSTLCIATQMLICFDKKTSEESIE